jgi:carboxypeptidase C (cathepsin A)
LTDATSGSPSTGASQGTVDSRGATPPATPEPLTFTRELSGVFNGTTLQYRAVAEDTYLRDAQGTPVASFFTHSYLATEVADPASRPVTFLFNGGPGSSAQWLHMGAFGPKRVVVPSEPQHAGAPPYPIVANELSLLEVSDLVFIDPIGTGYSRTLGGKDPKQYFGLLEDARSFADFIQTWITRHNRWNSPKYLLGESYGTARACLLADLLSERYIALNGIVMIAAVLDYQNSRPRPGDGGILSYASFLPTYTAAAWYHGKIDRANRTLDSLLSEARSFARTSYAQALIANEPRLEPQERSQLVARMAALTGLEESYIARSRLRVPVDRFFKELLRKEGLVIGRLDARYTGIERDSVGELAESDPTFDAIGSAFTSAMHVQLEELGVRMERPYLPMSALLPDWNWSLQEKVPNGGGYINVVPHLGRAMRHNPQLRVLAACGYYDLATPFFGSENALSQDGLAHERIAFTYYEVGHMLFVHEPSRVQLLHDVRHFIRG